MRPHSHAVVAVIGSPVSSSSSARLRPTAREIGTIGVEQKRPILAPGVAKRASSDATARSHAATSWQPAAVTRRCDAPSSRREVASVAVPVSLRGFGDGDGLLHLGGGALRLGQPISLAIEELPCDFASCPNWAAVLILGAAVCSDHAASSSSAAAIPAAATTFRQICCAAIAVGGARASTSIGNGWRTTR